MIIEISHNSASKSHLYFSFQTVFGVTSPLELSSVIESKLDLNTSNLNDK